MEKIILFGAARQGIEYYSENKEGICFFFDNDSNKWGKLIENVEIIKPVFLGKEYQIIVANDKHDIDMVNQLLFLGYRKFSVIYPKGQNIGLDAFGIDKFDYTNYENMEVNNRKVTLLTNTTSGSSSWCFKHIVEKEFGDNHFNLILLETKKKKHDYYYEIFTSKFIILTSSFTNIKNKIIIQCFHALPFKACGYMDKNIVDTSFELTHKDMINSNYILSFSKFYSLVFSACFGIPANRFLEIGMPRNDIFQLSNGKELLNRLFPISKDKVIILYMPTYRERTKYSDNETKGYLFMYPDFNIKDFNSFLEKNDSVLIIKMHVEDTKRFDHLSKISKNILFLTDESFIDSDFYQYINGTDILITDYSSIFFDYLLLDKPIIFAHLDEKMYSEERGILFEPLDFWCPGPRIKSIDELKYEISNILYDNDCYSEKRKQFKYMVHGEYKFDASEKLLEVMKRHSDEK